MAGVGAFVSYLLNKFGDVVVKRVLKLYHVSDQVDPMLMKLGLIQAFLKDDDSNPNKSEAVKWWVEQLRQQAQKIENALDTFLEEIKDNHPESSDTSSKGKMLVKHPKAVNRFCEEIEKIKGNLETINEGITQLGIKNTGAGNEENVVVSFRPTELHDIDDSDIVGFHSDKERIIGHLLDRSISRRTVLSIVGIGGLGKTTLAKNVFESVKGKFDCNIWLSISQKFDLTYLLREILCSIDPQMKIKAATMTDRELSREITIFLNENRYLIILDDVWEIKLWNMLKLRLPDTKKGCRVLITCRDLKVALAADPKTPYHKLSCLNEEDSLTLFLQKAFPHSQPKNYPPGLTEVAEQFAKKCGGLSLALSVLGSILSTIEPTYSAWQTMKQTMNWHNEEVNHCSQVLALSYNNLPSDLKKYFLYFASFPEDHKISAKHVTRMWVAEGFIPKDGDGTLEEKAHRYLEQLVQRCLVQVTEKSLNGNCKYCRVHDLIRNLAIHEAEKVKFMLLLKPEYGNKLDASEAPRATIQFCNPTDIDQTIVGLESTRSLLIFQQYISSYSGLKLLKVLTIEHVDMSKKKGEYGKWLEGLIHLRYLGFRYCGELSSGFTSVSFSSLRNLETLDFKGTYHMMRRCNSEALDHSLWKVPTLRHVISSSHIPFVCDLSKWNHFKNLQTLKWVNVKGIPELECNINLRKMGLNFSGASWLELRTVRGTLNMLKNLLKRMNHLVSLNMLSYGFLPFPIDDANHIPCYEKIETMFLSGKWVRFGRSSCESLTVEIFPTNLTKLTVTKACLSKDPMPILEKLQSLRMLRLWLDSYEGPWMSCSAKGFPSLLNLELVRLPGLCDFEIQEEAMPRLSQLKIEGCFKLHALSSLRNVPNLRDLIINDPSEQLRTWMQSEGRNYPMRTTPQDFNSHFHNLHGFFLG